MKKLLLVLSVFLLATGFTKQEITSSVDKEVLNKFKTEITKINQAQRSPWAIFTAIDANDYAEVKNLLDSGVKANQRDWANNTSLMWAAKRGYTEICELLLSYYTKDMSIDEFNEYGWTALMFAAANNRPKTIKLLIDKGADKNHKTMSFSETVLGVAATFGAKDAIIALLDKGADIEIPGDFGYTPLMYAVDANKADAVFLLISKKANVNATDIIGDTPLMIAASMGHYKILQILIANRAQINAKNEEDKTALMYAAENGYYDCVAYMLDDKRLEKAQVNNKDVYGKTALKYALENGHFKTAEFLKSKGAK